jgi:hypothetical protein
MKKKPFKAKYHLSKYKNNLDNSETVIIDANTINLLYIQKNPATALARMQSISKATDQLTSLLQSIFTKQEQESLLDGTATPQTKCKITKLLSKFPSEIQEVFKYTEIFYDNRDPDITLSGSDDSLHNDNIG